MEGDESAHLFWAIPRMSADDLDQINAASGEHHNFNVVMKEKQCNVITVGDLKGHSVATTWYVSVSVPMLTNPERGCPRPGAQCGGGCQTRGEAQSGLLEG